MHRTAQCSRQISLRLGHDCEITNEIVRGSKDQCCTAIKATTMGKILFLGPQVVALNISFCDVIPDRWEVGT